MAMHRAFQPALAPGAGFHHANTSYELLGLVVERVGGKPLVAGRPAEGIIHDTLFKCR